MHTHTPINLHCGSRAAAWQQLSGNHLLKVIMERRKRSDALRGTENPALPQGYHIIWHPTLVIEAFLYQLDSKMLSYTSYTLCFSINSLLKSRLGLLLLSLVYNNSCSFLNLDFTKGQTKAGFFKQANLISSTVAN